MQLPQATAGYRARVRYGRYVGARLQRAKRDVPAVKTAVDRVKAHGRKVEDLEEEVDTAIADRDAADDMLDGHARRVRRRLTARSDTAAQEPPYTAIFPNGLNYYTDATLDANAGVYQELIVRIEANLPSDDPIRTEDVPQIGQAIPAFEAASKAVLAARTTLAVAGTQLDSAEEDFDRLMEKVYGTLITELGKAEAEKFFPKLRSSRRRAETPAAPGDVPPG